MTQPIFPRSSGLIVNEDYTVWDFDFMLSTSLAIHTQKAIEILPEGLSPQEIDTDNSLINIAVVRFLEDIHSLLEVFTEVVYGVQVMPLKLDSEKMLPQMGLYILKLGANDNCIIESLDTIERSLFMDKSFQIKIDPVKLSVECDDQDGSKVFSMRSEGQETTYSQEMFHLRSFCTFDGRLFYSDLFFDMNRFEHQGKSSTAGSFCSHPFFHPVKFDGMKTANCYGQVGSEPGTLGKEYCLPFKPFE